MSQQYTSVGKQRLAFWAEANDCRLVDTVVRGGSALFFWVQFSGCQGRLDPRTKSHLTSSVVRLSGCLALPRLCFTHDILGSEIMSDGPLFHVLGFFLNSAPYYIFSCHKFLNVNHYGRNSFMRSSLLFMPRIWRDQVMKRRGKTAFYSKISKLGVGHKHKWCIWGLFFWLSSLFFFSWTQEKYFLCVSACDL